MNTFHRFHLAIGLGIEALKKGYKVSFILIDTLIHSGDYAQFPNQIKTYLCSDLVIIDDLMFMAMDRQEANLFFQLINKLYGQASIILTSNKGPED